jgi:hypothetical protein
MSGGIDWATLFFSATGRISRSLLLIAPALLVGAPAG